MDSGGVTTKDWFGGNMVQALWCRRAMGALGRWGWLLGFGGPQIQTAIVGGTMVYLWTDVFEYIIFNFIYIFIIYTYMYIYCTAHVFLRMYVSLLDFLWVVNTSYIHLRIWCILSLSLYIIWLYMYICLEIVCNPESYYNPALFIPIRSTEHGSRSVGSQGFVLQNQPIQCLDPPVFFRLHTFRFEVRWMRNVASRTATYILGTCNY